MSRSAEPEVSVIVPALNEEATIGEVVERLLALPLSVQVIVVDDGSTDRTAAVLAPYADRILILRNERPSGKGSAIRQALPHVRGEAVIIQDADLEYAPEQIPGIVRPILQGESDVVYGSRFTNGFPEGMALPNRVVNVLLAWTVRLLFFRRITDEATCYKAFRREVLLDMDLSCRRFEFCPEVTAKAIRMRKDILEVSIDYEPRSKAAGKKIRWTDAPDAFWTLLKWRFRAWKRPRRESSP
ncbi:MAG: glycosyltransferase family 2 protein [Fimbriimonadaceae bacterium]|nr:MAG: Glycosyltransferase involved in cell wall biogenesis [Armatimonadetes bacterium OLB18]WKZ81305.1 MAG: glycosyltransferase family 2 protein [Fimbriimonadaceae bacterium]